MPNQSKILFFVFLLCVFPTWLFASQSLQNLASQLQIDSLIQEKNINNDMTQLELLVLYNDAWIEKHPDSINVFKKLALFNAELEQPKDAYIFTEKYINNTLDLSILDDKSYDSIRETEEYEMLEKKYMYKFNFFMFLFLYVALIGFFFSIIINFTKKANRYAKIFIGSFVFVHSFFILGFVFYASNYVLRLPHTYLMSSVIALLYGPLLYFYFKSVIEKYEFRKIDLLHFLPTLGLLIFLYPIYSLPYSDKMEIILRINTEFTNHIRIIFVAKIISLVVYAGLIGKMLLFQKKQDTTLNQDTSIKRWMNTLFKIHVAYIFSYLIYSVAINVNLGNFSEIIYYTQVGIMSLMVVYIAYMAYVQPHVFNNEYVSTLDGLFFEKYKKSGLTDALSKELKENLIKLLVEDKIFKESNISLEILSNKLNTTRHNTSQIINEHFNMSFFELINSFRIKEAIKMLQEDIYGSLNIIDVAYEVGYNNKVTFNKAFKKETSMTPSEFINSQLRKV
jgi:AraC-like DNA-binding protein